DDDGVVDVAHVGPLELAVGELVEDAAQDGAGAVDVADVVDAHVPLPARPREGVGEAARGVVALEDEDAAPRVPRQHAGGGEAAERGADDDDVPGARDGVLLVRATDLHGFLQADISWSMPASRARSRPVVSLPARWSETSPWVSAHRR